MWFSLINDNENILIILELITYIFLAYIEIIHFKTFTWRDTHVTKI